jgi:hypothetical protein
MVMGFTPWEVNLAAVSGELPERLNTRHHSDRVNKSMNIWAWCTGRDRIIAGCTRKKSGIKV